MVYAIAGKTASGKDTVAKYLHDEYHLPFLVSYTTRPKREYETDGVEHFFVTEDKAKEITQNYTECLAITKINGYSYFTLPSQAMWEDYIYIIDPNGINYIKENFPEIDMLSFYVDCPEDLIIERAATRGDDLTIVNARLASERDQMNDFFNSQGFDFYLSNTTSKQALLSKVQFLMDFGTKFPAIFKHISA